jgi:hypothetical protein
MRMPVDQVALMACFASGANWLAVILFVNYSSFATTAG